VVPENNWSRPDLCGTEGKPRSCQPWITAIFLFATFFVASRLDSKILRVVLFWIPTVTISCIGITLVSFVTYVITQFKNS
jgi:hypothetical protein